MDSASDRDAKAANGDRTATPNHSAAAAAMQQQQQQQAAAAAALGLLDPSTLFGKKKTAPNWFFLFFELPSCGCNHQNVPFV